MPLLQTLTGFKQNIRPLDGAFYPESDISFSWSDWFNGNYSNQKDKYLKENFGLHNAYIRLICQVNFSLFQKSNVSYVVVGKDNYLYETAYIDAYYGRDFIGTERIIDYATKLKKIQDTLQTLNKLIFVALAPGKACFFPEFIPGNYKSIKKINNHDAFVEAFKSGGVNHIDFYSYFQAQKTKSKYPLYPQFGIHWSDYGSVMAMDSMIHYTEYKLHVDLPELNIVNIELADSLRNTDDDAIKSLNLLKNPKTFKMAYPNWKVNYDSTRHKKLKLLVVSDSFWWYIYSTTIPDNVFLPTRFWYYNKEMYPESFTSPTYVSQVNYAEKIREADVIIILHAEATLRKFGGGFVDLCYETYCDPFLRSRKIQKVKERIKANPEWFKTVIGKAKDQHLSIDSALTLDALYTLDQESEQNQ